MSAVLGGDRGTKGRDMAMTHTLSGDPPRGTKLSHPSHLPLLPSLPSWFADRLTCTHSLPGRSPPRPALLWNPSWR